MGLAQNAVQHTADGDPIWLGSDSDRLTARLWVRDTGPGVAADDQARIFDKFERVDPSEAGGTSDAERNTGRMGGR